MLVSDVGVGVGVVRIVGSNAMSLLLLVDVVMTISLPELLAKVGLSWLSRSSSMSGPLGDGITLVLVLLERSAGVDVGYMPEVGVLDVDVVNGVT